MMEVILGVQPDSAPLHWAFFSQVISLLLDDSFSLNHDLHRDVILVPILRYLLQLTCRSSSVHVMLVFEGAFISQAS